MQVQRIGYGIKGFYRLAALGQKWEMTPKDAQERLRILRFWERHGLSATQEAFGVSRRTLYRWKAALKAAGDNPAALIPKPPIAERKRGKNRDPRLVKRIRELRTLYPNLGKERLHRLLAPWCAEHVIALPSVSTIGRIIAEAPDKMRLVPKRLDARGRSKPLRPRVRKTRKPKGLKVPPMTLWALDTIEQVRDGVRRYILTLVDPVRGYRVCAGASQKEQPSGCRSVPSAGFWPRREWATASACSAIGQWVGISRGV